MGRVHAKVAAVFIFVDIMTERPVRRQGLQVQIAQQSKVVWKDTDCLVVLEQEGVSGIDVRIAGKYYQEVCLHVELTAGAPPQEHFIWLSPSELYPFQEDVTMIRGTCHKDSLYVLWREDNARYKLSETTTVGSDRVSLWGISGSVEGRVLLLREDGACGDDGGADSGSGCRMELITLLGLAEQRTHTYRTQDRIQHVFHRGKAKLYKAARVHIDSDRTFFMAFRREGQADGEVLFWSGGEVVAALQTGEEREYFENCSGLLRVQ